METIQEIETIQEEVIYHKRDKRGIFAPVQNFLQQNKIGRFLSILAVVLFPLYVTVMTNVISYHNQDKLQALMTQGLPRFLYGALVVYGVFLAIGLFTKRFYIGGMLLSFVLFVFGTIDYFKMIILSDHFYPWDLFLAGNAGSFSTFLADLKITPTLVLCLVATVLYCILLYFGNVKVKMKWYLSSVSALVIVACVFTIVANNQFRLGAMSRFFHMSVNEMVDQEKNHDQNGFISAFCLNLGSLNVAAPQDYSEQKIHEVMAKYDKALGGATFENPDVIVILSEAFWDPTTLPDVSFSKDPMEQYRRILKEQHGGSMVTPTFGGGTVRPEFELLTGMTMSKMPVGALPYQQYIGEETWSFAKYYKDLNYDTIGVHTYIPSFYGRNKAYLNLGFDEFRGEHDLHVKEERNSNPYIADTTIMKEMIYEMEKPRDNGLFLFGITMENHGLYSEKYSEAERTIDVTSEKLDSESILAIENFAQGISNADAALGMLYDYVMEREKPTVVLYFGDHLPSLGKGLDPYATLKGLSYEGAKKWSQEERLDMFSTPYVTFANYDTKRPFKGDGVASSPSHLINLVSDFVDAPKIPFTQMLDELYESCPVYNVRYDLYSDTVEEETSKERLSDHWLLTYDQVLGKQYMNSYQK